MKDLKHLYYFEKLLEDANNELVRQAQSEGLKCCLLYTSQEEKLQNHQAGLFDGSSDGMVYYGLEKEKRTKPCVVTIEEKRLGMLGDDKDTCLLYTSSAAFLTYHRHVPAQSPHKNL